MDKFDEFYQLYPKKQDKKKARIKFNKLSESDQNLAIEDIKTRFINKDKQFVPMPSTYLNGERWNDEKTDNKPRSNKEAIANIFEGEAYRAMQALSSGFDTEV